MNWSELIKKLINKVDPARIACASCAALKLVTENEDAFGHAFAGTVCAFCALFAGREAVSYYSSFYKLLQKASKNTCKAVNSAATYGEQYFGPQNGAAGN